MSIKGNLKIIFEIPFKLSSEYSAIKLLLLLLIIVAVQLRIYDQITRSILLAISYPPLPPLIRTARELYKHSANLMIIIIIIIIIITITIIIIIIIMALPRRHFHTVALHPPGGSTALRSCPRMVWRKKIA